MECLYFFRFDCNCQLLHSWTAIVTYLKVPTFGCETSWCFHPWFVGCCDHRKRMSYSKQSKNLSHLLKEEAAFLFSRSYELAPPCPLFRQQVSLFFSPPVCRWSILLTGEGVEGGGGGAKSYCGERTWSSINHSILSSSSHWCGVSISH
jgi:hypothetical protein